MLKFTWKDSLNLFNRYVLEDRQLSISTATGYSPRVRAFISYISNEKSFDLVRNEDVYMFSKVDLDNFVEKMKKDGVGNPVISKSVSAVKMYAKFLNEHGFTNDLWKTKVKTPSPEFTPKKVFTNSQFYEIVRRSGRPAKDKAIVLIAYEGCVKRQSLWQIEKSDYHRLNKTLDIKDAQGEYEKTILLSDETAKVLEHAFEDMDMLVNEINRNNKDRVDFETRVSESMLQTPNHPYPKEQAVHWAVKRVAEGYCKNTNMGKEETERFVKNFNINLIHTCKRVYTVHKYNDIRKSMIANAETSPRAYTEATMYVKSVYGGFNNA